MEWVETTGKSIDDAVALALDQLGVDRDEAEVEVLEEPKSGLFGRVRSEARVRARVRPTSPRAKEERPRRRRSSSDRAGSASDGAGRDSVETAAERPLRAEGSERSSTSRGSVDRRPRHHDAEPLDAVPAEIEQAGRAFLTGLVDSMGLSANVDVSVVNANMIEFRINGRDLGVLIGPKAQTMQAVQELLRTVIHYETSSSSGRILLDVAGYREKRKVALGGFTHKVAAEVVASGQRRSMEPMSPPDRKVVHDTVNDIVGVRSVSEGEEPNRFVVLLPA